MNDTIRFGLAVVLVFGLAFGAYNFVLVERLISGVNSKPELDTVYALTKIMNCQLSGLLSFLISTVAAGSFAICHVLRQRSG